FISSYPRPSAQKVAEQLLPDSPLDASLAKLVSRREGIDVVIAAAIAEKGSGYRISAEARDTALEADEGKPLASAKETARSKEDVLPAVGRVAADLRKRLGDTAPESARLAASETFTASSLEAMSAYASAQDYLYQGNFDQALEQYEEAIELDPQFGRAYSGMAVVYANQKEYERAEESYQQALKQLDRMTERERYRTLGSYYLDISRNNEKAIENYETLVDLYPADRAGHANLALAYLYARDFDRAVEEGRKSIELEPNNLLQRTNYSMYLMYAGDFEESMVQARKVLEDNPRYGYARFTLARSAVAAGDLTTARRAYRELRQLGDFNAILADLGEADLEMYLGRSPRAIELLAPKVESDPEGTSTAALSELLAEANLAVGRVDDARRLARAASEAGNHESVLYPAARVLAATGDVAGAEAIALELENRLQSQTVSYARLIAGEIALMNNHLLPAVESLRDGWERNDSWLAHLLLGRAYLEAEHYPEALGEFQHCIEQQGEILDVFLVDGSTIRYLPQAYYYLGRAQEGIGDAEAASESYRRYLEIRSDPDIPDPLATDASARLGQIEAAEAS
ncbi:MAG: tetratricopeptide repeat protein, partial [Acidobacteriota bacterium]